MSDRRVLYPLYFDKNEIATIINALGYLRTEIDDDAPNLLLLIKKMIVFLEPREIELFKRSYNMKGI